MVTAVTPDGQITAGQDTVQAVHVGQQSPGCVMGVKPLVQIAAGQDTVQAVHVGQQSPGFVTVVEPEGQLRIGHETVHAELEPPVFAAPPVLVVAPPEPMSWRLVVPPQPAAHRANESINAEWIRSNSMMRRLFA